MQHMPIMPIHKLDRKPDRAATLWDISCDSDGEIPFDSKRPLFLHDINLEEEDYFIGFFLLGAYQEVLGMDHNLFTRPTESTVTITDEGFTIDVVKPSDNILDILLKLGYEEKSLLELICKHPEIKTGELYNGFHEKTVLGYTRYYETLEKLSALKLINASFTGKGTRGRSRIISLKYNEDEITKRL